jgi:hypothetical protein
MRRMTFVVMAALLAAAVGCGGSDAPTPEKTAPFTKAITQYFKDQSMGMKVDRYESLAISGDSAMANVRVSDKDIGYGLKPLWEFSFKKTGDAWAVTGHKQK